MNYKNMISAKEIEQFINDINYDIRETHNGRWIDQKCTADVVEIVSDCILNYSDNREEFMSIDIWKDKYSVQVIEDLFKKPKLSDKAARNEYDKFFQQPMEMLAYAGILSKRKDGNRNIYRIIRRDLLEYISTSARNSLFFMTKYITKVLNDSGLLMSFESFFDSQSSESYEEVKGNFANFTIKNTPINGTLECNRIFTKILNPLSYNRSCLGSMRGRISKHKITYDMLMYNRDNFRDIVSDKPKEMTRKEYERSIKYNPNPNYYKYESSKAKRQLRSFNNRYRGGLSEIQNGVDDKEVATQMHHIFPESSFPSISMYLENIIALTPTQHMNYAHPKHNTNRVDISFQRICLLAKSFNIENNLSSQDEETIYDFSNFRTILATGLNCEDFMEIQDGDFIEIGREIEVCYGK